MKFLNRQNSHRTFTRAWMSYAIFECKEGPFVPHEKDGILELPKK